jgi:hypothetical protein
LAGFADFDRAVATSMTLGYLKAPHRPVGAIDDCELLLSREVSHGSTRTF